MPNNPSITIAVNAKTQQAETSLKKLEAVTKANHREVAKLKAEQAKQARAERIQAAQRRKQIEQWKQYGRAITVAAAALGARALTAAIREASEMGAELVELGVRTGFTTERLQLLGRVIEGDGGSFNDLAKALDRFNRAIGEAGDGIAEYKDAFDQLGVSVLDGNGNLRQTEAVFDDVVRAMSMMDSEAKRAQLTNDLFGRSFKSLVNITTGGLPALQAQEESFRRIGVTSDEGNRKLKALLQTMTDLENRKKIKFADYISANTEEIENYHELLTDLELTILRLGVLATKPFKEIGLLVGDIFGVAYAELIAGVSSEELAKYKQQLEDQARRVSTGPPVPENYRAPSLDDDEGVTSTAGAGLTPAEERARRLANWRLALDKRIAEKDKEYAEEAAAFDKDLQDKNFDATISRLTQEYTLREQHREREAEQWKRDTERAAAVAAGEMQRVREMATVDFRDYQIERTVSWVERLGESFTSLGDSASESLKQIILYGADANEAMKRLLVTVGIDFLRGALSPGGLFRPEKKNTGGTIYPGRAYEVHAQETIVPVGSPMQVQPASAAATGSGTATIEAPVSIQINGYDRDQSELAVAVADAVEARLIDRQNKIEIDRRVA